MKKTLMVLTFALCATVVFAQTATPRAKELKAPAKAAKVEQSPKVSSIFTKTVDTLLTVDFHDGTKTSNLWTGTNYTTGVVTSPATEAHGQSYDFAYWQRWTATDADRTTMPNTYPRLATGYFGTQWNNYFYRIIGDTNVSTGANGFMLMSGYDQGTMQTGNYNAFVTLANVNTTTAGVVDVQFYQSYRKYYDNCYIDYSVNGTTWNAVEINVTGVDVAVNGQMQGFYTYTLPLAAAGQTSLGVRIRFCSLDSHRGQIYGYYWVIDDVSVIAGEANRLRYYDQEFVEGNYGLVPQGLQVNPAWYSQVYNNGVYNQANVNVELHSINLDTETDTPFASYNNGTVNAGSGAQIICDKYGWIYADSMEYRGWYGYTQHEPHGTGSALPTATVGQYQMYASVANDSIEHNYDSMFYEVTAPAADGSFRWAHDNGLLTYSPYNYWIFGYVNVGGTWYVTEDPEEVQFYQPGYMVNSRYTTDAVVPEGWVIRGVELVASPVEGYYTSGCKINAVLRTDSYTGGSVNFISVEHGAGTHTVAATEINDSTIIGREHGYQTLGNYNTIFIPFPEQPALQANTSYRIGYQVEEEAYLALACEAMGSYREASPTRPEEYDTIIYFRNTSDMSQYGGFYAPNQYQNYVLDPAYSSTFASYYVSYNPMIRMIVGPAQEVTRHNIEVSCEGEEFGSVFENGGESACGETFTPAESSTKTFTIEPVEGGRISTLKIDGEIVTVWDEIQETGDPNYRRFEYTDPETGATSVYFTYTFENILDDHTMEATFEEAQVGIDPVAAGVRMNLQPNPATSQVTLNVEGVEGMVNCSIIDMSGRVVFNSNINAANAEVISLTNLAKGAYFVRITNNNFSKVEKLIVR